MSPDVISALALPSEPLAQHKPRPRSAGPFPAIVPPSPRLGAQFAAIGPLPSAGARLKPPPFPCHQAGINHCLGAQRTGAPTATGICYPRFRFQPFPPPPIRTLGSPQHRGSMRDADALTHPWGSPSCGRSRLHPKGCVSPPIHSGSRAGSIPWERSDDGGELLGLHPQAPAASTWTPFPAVRSNGSGAPALGIESSVTGAELPQDVGPRGSFPAGKQPKSPPRAPRRGSAAPEAPE